MTKPDEPTEEVGIPWVKEIVAKRDAKIAEDREKRRNETLKGE